MRIARLIVFIVASFGSLAGCASTPAPVGPTVLAPLPARVVVVPSFVPSDATVILRFDGLELLGPNAVPNPLVPLFRADPAPFEDVGFVVFNRIGVAASGYHDQQEDQRAFTILRVGGWTTNDGRPLTAAELGL